MSFLHPPNEIILQISKELSLGGLSLLLRTNRHLACLLSPTIIERICQEQSREWCTKALYSAAEREDKATVTLLLEKAQEVLNYEEDPTLLEELIKTQSETVFSTLLECGVEADIKHSPGLQTPLHWAAQHGRLATLRLLIARNDVDVNAKDGDGLPPFLSAIQFGQCEIVKELLQDKRVDVSWVGPYGQGPLHEAATEGSPAVVRLLLDDERFDVNLVDRYDRTAIYAAAYKGHEAGTLLARR
ncbi:ankyrin [Choiromyces venosus 120613-1]|uniref:Ankyrin n=1 Tax=Choiromyces venosus 120613-1 TaxID=1336337 RepID=A0A3N4JBK5_9PEZI|nr:ankyrin [Choiromyces venosus 120613-1]